MELLWKIQMVSSVFSMRILSDSDSFCEFQESLGEDREGENRGDGVQFDRHTPWVQIP